MSFWRDNWPPVLLVAIGLVATLVSALSFARPGAVTEDVVDVGEARTYRCDVVEELDAGVVRCELGDTVRVLTAPYTIRYRR